MFGKRKERKAEKREAKREKRKERKRDRWLYDSPDYERSSSSSRSNTGDSLWDMLFGDDDDDD